MTNLENKELQITSGFGIDLSPSAIVEEFVTREDDNGNGFVGIFSWDDFPF